MGYHVECSTTRAWTIH